MEKALPESCLNCGQVITPEDAYCPNCGQKNRSSKLRLSTFLSDFVEDYFTVDAKFFKSLKRLIFFPGSLTREFNSGKRKIPNSGKRTAAGVGSAHTRHGVAGFQ